MGPGPPRRVRSSPTAWRPSATQQRRRVRGGARARDGSRGARRDAHVRGDQQRLQQRGHRHAGQRRGRPSTPSGSRRPTRSWVLVAALGSDIALPTTPEAGHVMVLDRFRTDVVTRVSIPSGEIVGQLRTHSTASTVGLLQQPAGLPGARPATAAGSAASARTPTPRGRRARRARTSSRSTPPRWRAPARAWTCRASARRQSVRRRPRAPLAHAAARRLRGRGPRPAERGLQRLGRWRGRAGGPADASLTSLTLTGLRNCGTIVPVPEDDTRALVACTGHSGAFDAAEVRASAGVVVVHLDVDDARGRGALGGQRRTRSRRWP
jgi:hypothetical protein